MSRRLLVATLLAPLLLSACGRDPEPKISAQPTPSPSSIETTSSAPKSETPEAFVQRWLDLSTEMQNTGVTDRYLAVTSNCASCKKVARRVLRFYRDGGYINFRGQTVTSSRSAPSNPGITAIRAVVVARPTDYRSSATSSVERFEGGTDTIEVLLVQPSAGAWLVTDYRTIAS